MQANHVATQLAQAAQIQAQMQAAVVAASNSADNVQTVSAISSANSNNNVVLPTISISSPMLIPSQPVFPGPVAVGGGNFCMMDTNPSPGLTQIQQYNGHLHIDEKPNGNYRLATLKSCT